MQTIEEIKVYCRIENCKTVCICKRSKRNNRPEKCGHNCEPDIVERDKFHEWEATFHRDRFGK